MSILAARFLRLCHGIQALNPEIDWNAVEEAYLGNRPVQIAHIDNFFSQEALAMLLDLARGSSIFVDNRCVCTVSETAKKETSAETRKILALCSSTCVRSGIFKTKLPSPLPDALETVQQ